MAKGDITHLECPFEHCNSSDAFNYNPEGFGYCQSCRTPYPSKKPVKPWAKEEYPVKEKEVQEKKPEPTKATYKNIRGIDEDVAKLYGIQLNTDDDGNPIRYAFKYPSNIKYRDALAEPGAKKTLYWTKDKGAIKDLFGPDFNSGSSSRLYLTEGEFDAASLYQALGKTFPVKGLPGSGISEDFIKRNLSYLRGFKEIVYAGELDPAGRRCAEKLFEVFAEKFWYIPLTKHKDANDFIRAGDSDELMWAARKPQRYTPENFFCSDDKMKQILEEENPYEYVPTGIKGLDAKMRGLVKGGITFIKAPRGTGKTEIARLFEMAMLESEDTRIALLHAEEPKSLTYRTMATYELGVNVRTREDAKWNDITEEKVYEASQRAAKHPRTIIFEMRSGDDPMVILDYIRLAATVYGADFIFVDHIQRLSYLSATGVDGATSMLTALGARAAQLCKELNVGLVFISQVNDDGRTKYAAALEEEAIVCILLKRNTESEDEREQNTTIFVLDKNRPFNKLGEAGKVYFNADTTILEEISYDI